MLYQTALKNQFKTRINPQNKFNFMNLIRNQKPSMQKQGAEPPLFFNEPYQPEGEEPWLLPPEYIQPEEDPLQSKNLSLLVLDSPPNILLNSEPPPPRKNLITDALLPVINAGLSSLLLLSLWKDKKKRDALIEKITTSINKDEEVNFRESLDKLVAAGLMTPKDREKALNTLSHKKLQKQSALSSSYLSPKRGNLTTSKRSEMLYQNTPQNKFNFMNLIRNQKPSMQKQGQEDAPPFFKQSFDGPRLQDFSSLFRFPPRLDYRSERALKSLIIPALPGIVGGSLLGALFVYLQNEEKKKKELIEKTVANISEEEEADFRESLDRLVAEGLMTSEDREEALNTLSHKKLQKQSALSSSYLSTKRGSLMASLLKSTNVNY